MTNTNNHDFQISSDLLFDKLTRYINATHVFRTNHLQQT